MVDNVVANWVVGGLAVVAFILLLKYCAQFLPDSGFGATIKSVLMTI